MQKFRVGVLMGGKSIEREVSFNSGRTVCDHLDTTRYEVVPLFQTAEGLLYILPWRFLHRGKISDFLHRLPEHAETITWDSLKQHIDFVYICTHGHYAEDGTLQGTLELLNIPYFGSKVHASALCMDKIMQKDVLRMHGIATPLGITVMPHEIATKKLPDIIAQMEQYNIVFPCIVKPHKEGSSMGVHVVHRPQDLMDAVQSASWVNGCKPQAVLIEEKLDGLEFSCITITDYKKNKLTPLPPTEIVPEDGTEIFDYEQKYMPGRAHKFTPARTTKKIITTIQDTCMATMQALGITNLSRIDGFVTKDNRIVIVDPNSLSGMAPSSFLFREAAEIGMNHRDLINHLIETELHNYGMLNTIITREKKMKQSCTKKMRIAVLLGGRSHEKEISLESGRNIVYKLCPQKHTPFAVFVNKDLQLYHIPQSVLVRNSTAEIEMMLTKEMLINWSDLPNIADFVFIGLHGGEGENGTVQGMLEMLGMPYNGSSVLASSLCINKHTTNQLLQAKGFDVPKGHLLTKAAWDTNQDECMRTILNTLPVPVIVKPHNDGCSVMVYKASNTQEIAGAIKAIFAHHKKELLIEEYISGMELTVGILGNENPQVLPPSQALSAHEVLSIQEKFLPGAGENQTPAPLSADATALVQSVIKEVYMAVGCKGYARIDCFYQSAKQSPTKKERVVIIEINTLPGMTPATCIFHQAAEIGMKPGELVDKIITLGLEEHAKMPKKATQQLTKSLH